MKIFVCIGSSCHLKGSREVVEGLQKLLEKHHLESQVELSGRFCMGNCMNGVCAEVDGQPFSVKAAEVEMFFEREILPRTK